MTEDVNQIANRIVEETVADKVEPEQIKNRAAVELGRLGGLKGGPARAKKLTKEERSSIARKAAQARWKKRDASG